MESCRRALRNSPPRPLIDELTHARPEVANTLYAQGNEIFAVADCLCTPRKIGGWEGNKFGAVFTGVAEQFPGCTCCCCLFMEGGLKVSVPKDLCP
mmetsp:Transcript_22064/g.43778  ORF Transcript_22064/g.43778 Transcript_22064/m.43778 type:complete len:96 (+) Transcript_22064:606-893(+)